MEETITTYINLLNITLDKSNTENISSVIFKEKEKYAKARAEEKEHLKKLLIQIGKSAKAADHVARASEIIDEKAAEFEDKTGLTKLDCTILSLAIGLQLLRQYFQPKLFLPNERLSDKEAAGKHEYSKDERGKAYYNPSLEEILLKPVPFDVIDGADGKLKNSGSLGHRGKTLGHDPLLGLVVGTANIATSTVTITNGSFHYESYHVRTNDSNRDSFAEHADNIKVLKHTIDKILYNTGGDGRLKVTAAFFKEIEHLKSDVYSKKSLPLPILTSISPKLASLLAEYGFDCANIIYVTKILTVASTQALLAAGVNYFIALLHGMFYDESIDERLYQVRTKKIICYSNAIAQSINLRVCGMHIYKQDYIKALESFDLGGTCLAIYNLVTSNDFINTVRHEFVIGSYEKEFNNIINGEITYS